jgi:trimethylamine-N-oxide reductase (cytochrome c)
MNPHDAEERGIKNNDLIKLHNERGAVICAAKLTHRVSRGVVHSYGSAAVYDPIGEPGNSPDRGGCVNLLSSPKSQIKKGHSMGASCCQIDVEKWSMGEISLTEEQEKVA